MTAYFSATTPQLQFENVHTSTDFINDWCSKQTEGMIPHIVNEQEISGNTLLAVLNAISFKATWTDKFDPRNTYEEDFLTGSEVCRTPMMHQRIEARYASNEMYSMVELPFGSGDKWSMKVLLPHEGMGIADIISRLCPSVWLADCQQLRPHIVDLALPRYKTVTELELNGIVSRMGAETMFQPATADFSLLTRNYKKAGSNGLFVSLLKQMSAAEVSEEGTQLAASSIADVVLGAQPVSEHAEFFANRPFVYVVEESSSGIIFFIGTFSGK
jgi:serpin B